MLARKCDPVRVLTAWVEARLGGQEKEALKTFTYHLLAPSFPHSYWPPGTHPSRRTCSASGATAQAGDHHFPPSSPCLPVPMPRPHDPKAPSFTFQTVHEIFSRLPHWLTHWKRPRHRFVGPAWDQGRAGDVQTCSGGQTGRWRNTGRLDQADALESSLGTAASPPQGGPGPPFPGLPV